MTIKTLLLATVAAGFIATPVLAVSQNVIDGIVADLGAQGFTRVRISNHLNSVEVTATGPNGTVERVFDGSGAMVRSESNGGNGLPGGVGLIDGTDDNGLLDGNDDNDHIGGHDDDNNHVGGRDDDDHGGRDDDDDDHRGGRGKGGKHH